MSKEITKITYDDSDIQIILGQRANRDLGLNWEKFKAEVVFYYDSNTAVVKLTKVPNNKIEDSK